MSEIPHWKKLGRVARELDAIAEREEASLAELASQGIKVNDYALNYPEEQRRLARDIREAVEALWRQ